MENPEKLLIRQLEKTIEYLKNYAFYEELERRKLVPLGKNPLKPKLMPEEITNEEYDDLYVYYSVDGAKTECRNVLKAIAKREKHRKLGVDKKIKIC